MSDLSLEQVVIILLLALLVFGARKLFRSGPLGSELWDELRECERLTVALLIAGAHKLAHFGTAGSALSHLLHELKSHMPVYSAETTLGKEAEFIRDNLPKLPIVLVAIALLVFVLALAAKHG